jgi:hypothetical protein
MTATFCMYGNDLNVYDFLENANNFPASYFLWEDVEIMKDEAPGFTLHFADETKSKACLFSLLKFILSNKASLQDHAFPGKRVTKEISIEFDEPINKYRFNEKKTYIFKPRIMRLLGELNISVYITGKQFLL